MECVRSSSSDLFGLAAFALRFGTLCCVDIFSEPWLAQILCGYVGNECVWGILTSISRRFFLRLGWFRHRARWEHFSILDSGTWEVRAPRAPTSPLRRPALGFATSPRHTFDDPYSSPDSRETADECMIALYRAAGFSP